MKLSTYAPCVPRNERLEAFCASRGPDKGKKHSGIRKVWHRLFANKESFDLDLVMLINDATPKLTLASGVSPPTGVDFPQFMQMLDTNYVIPSETRETLEGNALLSRFKSTISDFLR